IELVIADAAVGGTILDRGAAFRDVLWQESMRQKARLPSSEPLAGRREIVRQFRSGKLSLPSEALKSSLPDDVELTACGQRELGAPSTVRAPTERLDRSGSR